MKINENIRTPDMPPKIKYLLFLILLNKYSSSRLFILLSLFISFHVLSLLQAETKTDSLRSALSIAKEDTNKVNSLNNLGWQLKNSNPDTSIILSNQALSLAKKLRWKKGMANSLGNLGVYNRNKGDYPMALEHYFNAYIICKELENSPDEALAKSGKNGIARHVGNIGVVYYQQGNYPKALEHYFKACEINTELGNKIGITIWLGNIGNVYLKQGNYPKALEHYFKALEISKELGNKREKEKKVRRDLLIYSIILISIIILFIALSVSGRLHSGKLAVSQHVLEGGLFVSFLLLFEFILVLADPYIEQFTGGAPAWKFSFNVVMAALIFPVHAWMEGKMRKRLYPAL